MKTIKIQKISKRGQFFITLNMSTNPFGVISLDLITFMLNSRIKRLKSEIFAKLFMWVWMERYELSWLLRVLFQKLLINLGTWQKIWVWTIMNLKKLDRLYGIQLVIRMFLLLILVYISSLGIMINHSISFLSVLLCGVIIIDLLTMILIFVHIIWMMLVVQVLMENF